MFSTSTLEERKLFFNMEESNNYKMNMPMG